MIFENEGYVYIFMSEIAVRDMFPVNVEDMAP